MAKINNNNRAFYHAVHYWLKHNFGKAIRCESNECVGKSKTYQYALLRDAVYDFKRENFIQLCRSCHARYDVTDETRKKCSKNHNSKKTHCPKNHEFTKDNTYTYYGHRATIRFCKQCRLVHRKNWKRKQKVKDI